MPLSPPVLVCPHWGYLGLGKGPALVKGKISSVGSPEHPVWEGDRKGWEIKSFVQQWEFRTQNISCKQLTWVKNGSAGFGAASCLWATCLFLPLQRPFGNRPELNPCEGVVLNLDTCPSLAQSKRHLWNHSLWWRCAPPWAAPFAWTLATSWKPLNLKCPLMGKIWESASTQATFYVPACLHWLQQGSSQP